MASIAPGVRSDAELACRVATGDAAAFAVLDGRHRRGLTRYAGSLLRRSEHDAEDVVQDVLIRAHDALSAGNGPDELRPWLYRLTRNRAIDEVRRARWGDQALEGDAIASAGDREDPDRVLRRKESVRSLVDDLADLPVRQRTALLAIELDDEPVERVAEQLGVSVMAVHKLAGRARENLIKTRDARDADCVDVRVVLMDAHERGARPSEHGVRHVKGCDACRTYQRDLRRLAKRLHGLSPSFGLPLLAGLAKLFGGGGKAAVGAAAAALVVTGALVVLRFETVRSGEPAPFRLIGVRDLLGRPVKAGAPVPAGVAVVLASVRLPAGPPTPQPPPSVTLPCPSGMRFAGLQEPEQRLPRSLEYHPARDALQGKATRVAIFFSHRGLPDPVELTVGMHCQRPNAYGAVFPLPAHIRKDERLARVCHVKRDAQTRSTPGGAAYSFVPLGAIVAVRRTSPSGRWTLVRSGGMLDPDPAWMKSGQVCQLG